MSATANRVIKNTGYLYAKMGITMFISLYTTRLVLNSLGASDFGIFNIVGGAIAMLGFLNAAMASATQRFMSYSEGEGNKEKQKSIFNVSLLLHLGISLVAGIVLLIAGYFFFNGILNIPEDRTFAAQVVYGCLIVSTMFTIMTVPYDAAMNAHENMKYYAAVGILESLLKLAVAFACVYTRFDKLIVYGTLMACIPLITLTIMRVYCHKHYEECTIAPRRYWDKGLMKEITGFAGWSFCGNATGVVGNYGLGIVLNMFFGTTLNAAQGIASQIMGQLGVFTTNMLKAINPIITKNVGAGKQLQSNKLIITSCKFSYMTTAFFTLPVIIETNQILSFWLKNVPTYTVVFTQLYLIKTTLEQIHISLVTSIHATGHIKMHSINKTILNIIPLFATYLAFRNGFPPYSMYLIGIFFWGIIGGAINIYFYKTICDGNVKEFNIKVVLPCITMAITIIASCIPIIWYLPSNIVRLILVLIICGIEFLTLSYIFCLNTQERNIIKHAISRMWNKLRNK